MEKIKELWSQFTEWLVAQQWFQELRARWEELDPQSQMAIRIASAVGGVVVVGIFILGSIIGTYSLKAQVHQKNDLLVFIQSANDEIKMLRSTTGRGSSETPATQLPWEQVFAEVATSAGIPKEALTSSPEKAAPAAGGAPTAMSESLFDLSIQKTSIKKLVKFALELESQQTPIKIRNLVIDTIGPEGYLNAKLSVSGFSSNKASPKK